MVKKIVLLFGILCGITAFYLLDLHEEFNLENLQKLYLQIESAREENFVLIVSLYFLAYFVGSALCLPGISVVNVFGGVIFGMALGGFLNLLAVSLGTSLSFLVARFFLRDFVVQKFSAKISKFEEKLRQEGTLYLFSIRLIPIIPYFVISLAFGATAIRLSPFFWATLFGMLPMTLLYTQVGASLAEEFAKLQSIADLVSPAVVISLGLLALFPPLAKRFLLPLLRRKKNNS